MHSVEVRYRSVQLSEVIPALPIRHPDALRYSAMVGRFISPISSRSFILFDFARTDFPYRI
jgi:hypothetical protein